MNSKNRTAKIIDFLGRRSGLIILSTLVVTLLLVIPLLAMAPDEQASADPSGEVFELRAAIDNSFEPLLHITPFIAESRDGDILTQAGLWELYQNTQHLLRADAIGELAPDGLPAQSYLYSTYDIDSNRPVAGVTTIADVVQQVLTSDPRLNTTLELASNEQVKLAVHRILSDPNTAGLADTLSVKAQGERRVVEGVEIEYWTSPALRFLVLADNEKLGGGSLNIGIGGGETILHKEGFSRNVQRILRGDQQSYRLWGIAIDANLESAEEGQVAGMFIMFTVIAAVLIVGLSLRSYWAMALTGAGLSILMIWLKGFSNLAGIKGGLVIELIVPIAMISLGVDFAVHALRRYQEEKALGYAPARALQIGLAGVFGALVLAMLSDSIAFLSNTSSDIEAVTHFGIAAAIAVVSSFVVLGVVVPLAMMRIDRILMARPREPSFLARVSVVAKGVGVAVLFGTAVIFMVAVSAPLGVAIFAATVVGFLVAPLVVVRRRNARQEGRTDDAAGDAPRPHRPRAFSTEGFVGGLARFAPVVLMAAAGITAAAVLFALRLDPTFDVKDFFDHDSDFVIGLDKLDEHVAGRSGEPAIAYIRGDLTDPRALEAIHEFTSTLSDNRYVARDASGEVATGTTLLDLLARITGSDYGRGQVLQTTGVEILDANGDGIPDTSEQVKASYDYMTRHGVPLDERTLVFDPGQVRSVLFHDPDGDDEENVTVMALLIPGTREQTTVTAAHESLNESIKVLGDSEAITRFGLTGSPFAREAQLGATSRTLRTSLPIAAAGAFVLLLLTMRSIRYALVTTIPIGLVVAWLYGLMYLLGFSLNFVTATIGAVSVGVGIDYSIHMTERFREELRRAPDKVQAMRQAARGTGLALVASAASSIVGFAIMGLAPMPMFASYGLLTALMIFLALTASLVVLPSLLLLVTPERVGETVPSVAPAD
jgi:predicted RND superfamily exporter protein